jgi:hypothetical protein
MSIGVVVGSVSVVPVSRTLYGTVQVLGTGRFAVMRRVDEPKPLEIVHPIVAEESDVGG